MKCLNSNDVYVLMYSMNICSLMHLKQPKEGGVTYRQIHYYFLYNSYIVQTYESAMPHEHGCLHKSYAQYTSNTVKGKFLFHLC